MVPNTSSPEIFGRVRVTSATVRRSEMLIKVLEELRTRNMTMFQLADFLGYSPSGTRKYVRDLKNSEMIQTVSRDPKDCEIFALIDDLPAVQAFIDKLNAVKSVSKYGPKIAGPKPIMAQRHAGRQIYTSFDDAPFKLSTTRNAGEGKRDLMVALLFGRKDHQEVVDLPIPEKEQTSDNSIECAEAEMA